MHLYVVVGGEKGSRAIAVFSTRERALTFIDERGLRKARVQECILPASYTYPAEVYAAHESSPRNDTLVFTDLSAERQQASEAAGKDGEVIALRPDNKAVENIH